jgi:hypothetical protein
MALSATGAGAPFEHWIGLARQARGMPLRNFISYYPRANGGSSVSSPLVAYLDGECNLRLVELHLHPLGQVGLAVGSSRLTARPTTLVMGEFDVKARDTRR